MRLQKTMKITPKQVPGRQGFRISFRHPARKGNVVTAWLGTKDLYRAEATCRDICLLCADQTLWPDPYSPKLFAYDSRAVEIFFGIKTAARPVPGECTPDELADLGANVLLAMDEARDAGTDPAQWLGTVLNSIESKRIKEKDEQISALQNKIKVVEPERDFYRDENLRLRRQHSVDIKVAVAVARLEWEPVYKIGRAPLTVKNATHAVDSFIASLPGQGATKLGEIRAGHVDGWLAGAKPTRKGRVELSPATKRNMKMYLSSFIGWARRRYEMSANPLELSAAVPGAVRAREHIVAIRREAELHKLIADLKPHPYWQAWVATACLAGPRWSEQVWLKLDDVYLADAYIRIASRQPGPGMAVTGTKTGRERNVPIEQTLLRGILEAWVERRHKERKAKRPQTSAARTPWLFPTTLDANPWRPRTKTPAGLWSSDKNFLEAWRALARQALDLAPTKEDPEPALPEPWKFGPREWRHTFGTALGMCGSSSLEIADLMGNSEDICKRHYVAPSTVGKRWTFQW